jgi:polysaccharide export outer membrane protein
MRVAGLQRFRSTRRWSRLPAIAGVGLVLSLTAEAQTRPPAAGSPANAAAPATAVKADVPADYVIGPEDVLYISVWREPDMSAEAVVRPDGKITLPVLNEIVAEGLTPEKLRGVITDAAKTYVTDPNVSVVVRQIRSRRVFVSGNVARTGLYPLNGPTTVVQLIATAGGLLEYAKKEEIVIVRVQDGKTVTMPFNYSDILKRKNLQQNIELRPGDTVLVP